MIADTLKPTRKHADFPDVFHTRVRSYCRLSDITARCAACLSIFLLVGCFERYDKPQEEADYSAALDAYLSGVIQSAKRYAESDEPAETVAAAALASQEGRYQAMEKATIRWVAIAYYDGVAHNDVGIRAAHQTRDTARGTALQVVLDARLIKKKAAASP